MCNMARSGEVCEECHRYCVLLHQGKHDQPLTFFKIMFGEKFSSLLILPPTISRKLSYLEGKNSWIEDRMGEKWKVVLSNVKGSLAFKKGWNNFFADHKIELGDLLTFHYIRESHFMVTIYGRSGGEKPFPVERRNQNKRPKTATHSITENDSLVSFHDERESPLKNSSPNTSAAIPQSDTDSIPSNHNMNNVSKSLAEVAPTATGNISKAECLLEPSFLNDKEAAPAENISKAECLQEPNFLNDKETTFAGEDDRQHLFDLSVFESPDMKPCIAMQDDRDRLIDLPTFNMANNNADDSEDHRAYLLDTPFSELPDVNTSFTNQGDVNFFSDLTTSKLADTKIEACYNNDLQVEENTCSPVFGAFHEVQAVNASHELQVDENSCSQVFGASYEVQAVDASLIKKESSSKLADKNVDDSYHNEQLQVKENTCSQVFGALQEVQAVDSSPIGKESSSKLAEKNVDATRNGEFQVEGHTCSQVMDALHIVQAGNASIDAKKSGLSHANSVLPETPSVSPRVDMPVNSSLPLKSVKKVETFERSTTSKYSRLPEKTDANRLNSECVPVSNVSPGVDMPQKSSLPLKSVKKVETFELSTASRYNRLPGGKLRAVKQEPSEFGQALFNNVVHDTPGANLNSMEDKAQVTRFVKPEPVDFCDSDSAPTIRITCTIPPDSESFLVLPQSLPMKRGQSMKLRQKLILLRNSAGTVWPVLYHNRYDKFLASGWKEFRKANKIRSGHVCSFVLDDLEKGIFSVEISSS